MAMEASSRRTRQRTSRPGAGSVGWSRLSIGTELGRTILLGIFEPQRLVAEERAMVAAPATRHDIRQSVPIPN